MDTRSKFLYLWRMESVKFPPGLDCKWLRLNAAPRIYRCEPSWSWTPPPLPDYDLLCVLDGSGELILNGTHYSLYPYLCFVLPPDSIIRARHDPQHRLRVFAAHFDLVKPISPAILPAPGQPIRDGAFVATLAQQGEAAWQIGDSLGRQQATGLVAQILLHLWVEAHRPAKSPVDSRTAAVITMVREDPGRYWSVSALAKLAGLSRSQFSRHLTATIGLSPERFLIQTRIDRAKHLLRDTAMPIGQIADALGYRDAYYFSRQFARVAGTTASAFRDPRAGSATRVRH